MSRAASARWPWWRGWLPILLLPAAVLLLVPAAWPRWAFMWTLAAAIFAGCKWLTWRRTPVRAPWWRHAAYLFGWPGLNAREFLDPHAGVAAPAAREWLRAALTTLAGLAVLLLAARIPARDPYVTGWVGMIGLVLLMHFGTFHILSCAWRSAGVNARPLMNSPLRSRSVGEFWGRRWNTAFRDLTHRFLFRPLADRFGARGGLVAGFVFSGLVHELAISVPAGGGHGGPTVFFVVQLVALLFERSRSGRRLGLGHGALGWAFAMLVLVAPVGLLFHRPFVVGVIVPLLEICGIGR